jgi:SPP1 family predicted phage head-tail adaptor
MPSVAAGDLRHFIEIQVKQRLQDPSTGEMLDTWIAYANVWAQIVPMSAREFIASAAEQSEVRGRIVIRYRDDIDATMRVVYRGKFYEILGVMEDDVSMREHLTLMVGEGVRQPEDNEDMVIIGGGP